MQEIEVTMEIKAATPKALLCTDDGEREMWIPKSQINPNSNKSFQNAEKGQTLTFALPKWLAKKKELV